MKVGGQQTRTIWVEADGITVGAIDQTLLPHRIATLRIATLDDAARAIKTMQVRGAPLIGVTAAYGICLALHADTSDESLHRAVAALGATRPTAINLKWALDEMVAAVRNLPRSERVAAAYRRAADIADDDVAINQAIGRNGLTLIEDVAVRDNGGPVNVLTHCNAGWLATVDWGTALAPIYVAHDKGMKLHVWVDETRPRNQGAALTAWELGQHGVPHTVIADNTGGHLMQHGQVDLVLVGTDRVTAQGDVCNKIGTYLKALAAKDNGVPFYVAVPSTDHRLLVVRRLIGNSDRAARLRGAGDHDGPHVRRPDRDRAGRARGLGRRQLRLRRDAGASRHRPHHRARYRSGDARGAGQGVSRARRSGAQTGGGGMSTLSGQDRGDAGRRPAVGDGAQGGARHRAALDVARLLLRQRASAVLRPAGRPHGAVHLR